jgi:putative phosphoesterase
MDVSKCMRIGIIADTHGVVHPRLADVFAGVDHIVHAGDIGGTHVLRALRAIAPVTSVEGNNDGDSTGEDVVRVTLGDLRILLTHILPRPHRMDARVRDSLRKSPADVVIFGHSHLPHDELAGGVRFFNPASAGPRRFDYPTAVGLFDGERFTHIALDERSVEALKRRMNQLSR